MNQHENDNSTPPPLARPVDPDTVGETGFMSGQIRIMRRENPEIWERIDALAEGNFNPLKFKRLFSVSESNCEDCGYNLRGNVSGVCPECGTPFLVTAEARRMTSIRIFDALRSEKPDRWRTVSENFEQTRMKEIKQELETEGKRRDSIRRKALQSWLERKRRGANE